MDIPFINRLPPELLVTITTFITDQNTIFQLATVCRHWHDTLTGTATLWTSIDCRSRSRTSILLQRSKSSPIDVTVDRAHYVPEVVPIIASHTHRMRSIHITLSSREFKDLQSLLDGPAPILNEMWIDRWGHHPARSLPLCISSFQGQFPALRILGLSGHPFDFARSASMVTNGLTKLLLQNDQSHRLRDLLYYLKHCKNLEYLDIGLPNLQGTVPTSHIVSLPKLRELRLDRFLPAFFHHLSFPPSTDLAIQSMALGAQDGTPYISESRTIKSIKMKVMDFSCVVRLSGAHLAITEEVCISVFRSSSSRDSYSDRLDSLQSFPIGTTTFFGFAQLSQPSFVGTPRQQSCTQLLKKMPVLEQIALDISVAPLFIHALEPVNGNLLCPKLRHLTLIQGDDHDEVDLRAGLLYFSNRRKEHGSPLMHTIESYNSSDWWKIPLRS